MHLVKKIFSQASFFRGGLFFIVLLFSLFGMFNTVSSSDLSKQEVKELIIRTDQNAFPQQYETYMVIKNYKPGRDMVQNNTHCYRKGNKTVAIFLSPASQKGQAFIRDGDNMWMYLPKSEKVIRISAKENSMGGEASNADLLRENLSEDYDGSYLEMETVDGIICYKLELTARRRTVAYDRLIYWISQGKELPVKRDYYTISGKKIKTMYFKDLKVLGGAERPSIMRVENAQNSAYKTEIIIEEMNVNVNIDDKIFNPNYVKRL